MNPELQQLQKELAALKEEFYRNNFSSSQDFNKYSRFNTRLKVPHYATLPSVCEVGEIAEQGGELNICSAANTWTVCGTQT
jgi:hypothetical protein